MRRTSLLFFCFGLAAVLPAQFSGTQTLEFRWGNIPFNGAGDYKTGYSQSNLRYEYQGFDEFLRYERFLSPVAEREYGRLSQKRIRYNGTNITVKAGNIYEIIGRGLMF